MAKSFLNNNMKFDRILSFGLLATTALYFDRKKIVFILAAPLLRLGITSSVNYISCKLGYQEFGKEYSKYFDPVFDITMYCFKAPMQSAAVSCFGEVYGSLLGKAGALFISKINQEFAASVFKEDSDKPNKECETVSEKIHRFMPIFSSGIHIALGFMIRDSIDSRLKIPLLSVGVIVSSLLLYSIKPTERHEKGKDKGKEKYSGVCSYVASHSALLNFSHITYKLLSSTSILSEHSQVCHFITNKVRTLLSSHVRDCTNLLGK